MKRFIIILGLIFISNWCYASGFFDGKVKYHFELGNSIDNKKTAQYYQNKESWRYTFIDMRIGYNFDLFCLNHLIYFQNRWWSIRSDKIFYTRPFREIYTTGYKLSYKNFYLRLEHFCNHPVRTDLLDESDGWMSNMWGETMSTISFGLSNW